MKQSKKIAGRRDYWTLDIHYGEYQCNRRHLIEKDINGVDGLASMLDGVKWFNNFVDENERTLAFADGEINHMRVALVEDEDGEVKEDWYDVDEIGGERLYWDRSSLDNDDTVEESDEDEN